MNDVPAGHLRPIGRLTEASNATFLVVDEAERRWVYKPVAGEAPLWDFPHGTLARREVAAHQLSEQLGLGVVPTTVWLDDGPAGPGSAQAWFDGAVTDLVDLLAPEDLDSGWLPVLVGVDEHERPVVLVHRDDERLRRTCLFDLVLNNSDRKAGHLLQQHDTLVGVDHGVSLHVDDKHRTVLWGFAHQEFTPAERDVLGRARDLELARPEGLDESEWEAVSARADHLLELGVFPTPSGRWPAIPWPAW